MSRTFDRVKELVSRGEVRVSSHGHEELQEDGILVVDVLRGLQAATVIEEYADYGKDPCVLLLHRDSRGEPIHILWGLPRGALTPAVVVTGYRPDSDRWSEDFLRRKP